MRTSVDVSLPYRIVTPEMDTTLPSVILITRWTAKSQDTAA